MAPFINTPPLYHCHVDAAVEVSVKLPSAQKVVGPLGVIVGVVAKLLTVTVVFVEAGELHPVAFIATTVYPADEEAV